MDNNYSYAELFVSPDKLATSIEKSDVLILKSKELQNEIYEFRSILNNNKLLRDACINTPDLLCNLLEIYADDLVKESNKMKYKKEAFLMEANNYSKNPQGEVNFNLSKETISKLETNEKLAKEQSAENKNEINTELVSEDILTSTRKKDDGELLNRGEATSVTLASLGITNADLERIFKFKHTSGTFGNKKITKKIIKDVIKTPKPDNPIPDDIHEDDTIINNNNQNNNIPNNNFNTTNNQTTSENTKQVEENKPEKPQLEKVEPNKKENTTPKEVEKENNNKNIFEKSNKVEETKPNNKVEEVKPNNNTKTFVVKPSTNQNTNNNQNIKSNSNNNYNNVFDNKNIAGGDTKPSPVPEKGIEKLPEIEKPTTHVQGTPIIRKPGTPVKEVREGTNLVVPIMGGLALGGGAAAGTKVYLSRLDNDSDEDDYDDDYEDENTEDYEVDYNDETNNKEEYLDFDNSDKPVEKYSARKTN